MKTIMIIAFLFVSVGAFAQKQDSIHTFALTTSKKANQLAGLGSEVLNNRYSGFSIHSDMEFSKTYYNDDKGNVYLKAYFVKGEIARIEIVGDTLEAIKKLITHTTFDYPIIPPPIHHQRHRP